MPAQYLIVFPSKQIADAPDTVSDANFTCNPDAPVFESRSINNIRLVATRDDGIVLTWIDSLTSELVVQGAILRDAGARKFGQPIDFQLLNRTVITSSSESAEMVHMPFDTYHSFTQSNAEHLLVGSLKDDVHTIFDVKVSFPYGGFEVSEKSSRKVSRVKDVSIDPLVSFAALPNNTVFFSYRNEEGRISAEMIEVENHTVLSSYFLPIEAQYVVMGSWDFTERLSVALGWLSPLHGFFASLFPAKEYPDRLAYDHGDLWLCNNSGVRPLVFDTFWHVDHEYKNDFIPGNFIGNETRMRRTCEHNNRAKHCNRWRSIPIGDWLYDGYMELSFEILGEKNQCHPNQGCAVVFGAMYSNKSLNGEEEIVMVTTQSNDDYPITLRGIGWYSGKSTNDDEGAGATVTNKARQMKVNLGDVITLYASFICLPQVIFKMFNSLK